MVEGVAIYIGWLSAYPRLDPLTDSPEGRSAGPRLLLPAFSLLRPRQWQRRRWFWPSLPVADAVRPCPAGEQSVWPSPRSFPSVRQLPPETALPPGRERPWRRPDGLFPG